MTLSVMWCCLLIAALLSTERRVALAYALIAIVHDFASAGVPDTAYYVSAAFSSSFTAAFMAYAPPTIVSVRLAALSVAAVVANLYGFVTWWLFLPPDSYDAVFTVIYACAIAAMIIKRGDNVVGPSGSNGWGAGDYRGFTAFYHFIVYGGQKV